MQKQLTINIDEHIYHALFNKVGKQKISLFIEDLVRSHIARPDMEAAYKQMSEDMENETKAFIWSEETLMDHSNETW